MKPVKLSEEEKQLRALGMQFERVLRQVEGIEKITIPTLKDEVTRLGIQIGVLQKQAEIRRVEKQIEEGQKKEKQKRGK